MVVLCVGRRRDEILDRFQPAMGWQCRVVGSVGSVVSVVGQYVAPVGADMSWVGLNKSRHQHTAARQSYTRCNRQERQKRAARMRRARRRGSSSPE